ncbi:MAG: restriction endonuclease, SacI family [Planctomycetes bacterium]|nr:restriction endonuclease, SacI family [Planctomycetota bacterium]
MGELLMAKRARPLVEKGRKVLAVFWEDSLVTFVRPPTIPDEISLAIERSVNSDTLTYRYVLPTQLLAKVVEASLDCRAIQAGAPLARAFDARSLCHSVIVDFDRSHHDVLGGSKEPYLNNPLRIPAITRKHRGAQKDKAGFDDLAAVLEFAQSKPELASDLFRLTLESIRRRLATVTITYPVPNRISLRQTEDLLGEYLASRSGGTRMQAVAVALFRCIGRRFRLFSEVRSANVNAADLQTGITADLECVDDRGVVLFAVEVKDRMLTLHQLQDKLPGAREKGIGELIFLVNGGIDPDSQMSVKETIERQFVTGQNVYVCEFAPFLQACLVLFGEGGRRQFFLMVGEELDNLRADLAHRQDWCNLLQKL